MRAETPQCSGRPTASGWRRTAISTSLIAVLAAMPTTTAIAASASAASPNGSETSSPASVTLPLGELEKLLSQGEADSLLAGLPLSDLDVTQLTQELLSLPGVTALVPSLGLGGETKLRESIETAIADLGPNATLGQVLDPSELVPQLSTSLNGLTGGLLSVLLGGNPSTALTGALGSLNEGEILGPLLSAAGDPATLVQELLSQLSPGQVENVLGSTLSGEPVSQTTVEGLATQLGTTPDALASDMGSTSQQLPATAMALTAPLSNGKSLGMIDGLGGLTLSVLNPNSPGGGEAGNGTGGNGGGGNGGASSGGSDGSAGTGAGGQGSGAPGGTTIVVNTPATQAGSAPSANPRTATPSSGHVRVLSHQVKGRVATLIVQVPAAGKVTLSGKHVSSSSRLAARAELVTLKVTLAKATSASLHKQHKHLNLTLKTAFKPLSGAGSSASITVSFS